MECGTCSRRFTSGERLGYNSSSFSSRWRQSRHLLDLGYNSYHSFVLLQKRIFWFYRSFFLGLLILESKKPWKQSCCDRQVWPSIRKMYFWYYFFHGFWGLLNSWMVLVFRGKIVVREKGDWKLNEVMERLNGRWHLMLQKNESERK